MAEQPFFPSSYCTTSWWYFGESLATSMDIEISWFKSYIQFCSSLWYLRRLILSHVRVKVM